MKQAELFEPGPFLGNKLGEDIFSSIPESPGVYRFYDENGTLLYVGKAKNLRRRLFSYKRAKPGKTSRKEAALIRNICRIEFDVTETEEQAFLLENEWIRTYRPEFNYANKQPETYYYISVLEMMSGFYFALGMKPVIYLPEINSENMLSAHLTGQNDKVLDAKLFGCFKGHRPVRDSLGALLRLLWMVLNQEYSPLHLPVQLNRNLTPSRFFLTMSGKSSVSKNEWKALVTGWFSGQSPELVYCLIWELIHSGTVFSERYILERCECLLRYFDRTLSLYPSVFEALERPLHQNSLIFQNELDDWMVRIKNR